MLLYAVCLAVTVSFYMTNADLASTWAYCNCRWDDWQEWSECTSDCFGQRVRTRSVWLTEYPGCDEFNDCATDDEGSQWEGCNEVCHNGGTATIYSSCNCQLGYHGSCCTERVDCGTPDSIEYGSKSVTSTYYGGTTTYTCDPYHNMTGGDSVRTCLDDFTWSGVTPQCIFAYHCDSSPCMNGATCVNLLGDFECDCTEGWDGKLCENDVQPPVMLDCSEDIEVNATDITETFSWVPPSFYDPMGKDLDIVSNYPSAEFTFPWGDHTVQYVATKTSNGLRTECTFQIKVRPTPCEELNVPINGARVCNRWKTDYGRFCIVTCHKNYTLLPSEGFETMYVCGASGTWSAGSLMPDCLIGVPATSGEEVILPDNTNYSYDLSSGNYDTETALQNLYLETLYSNGFSTFCTEFSSECNINNVDVQFGIIEM